MSADFLTVTDTAKLLRQTLKAAFPGVKFSVRSDRYAGGASIDIHWTDGPTEDEVKTLASLYEGATFDGMTDMKNYHTSLIGSPAGDVREVHFGADFIFEHRTLSDDLVNEGAALAEHDGHCSHGYQCRVCGDWMTGDCWTIATVQYDRPTIDLVCSPRCAGRIYARHTSR